MHPVLLLFLLSLVPLLTLAWWWWCDARMREWRKRRWPRLALAAWGVTVLVCYVWTLGERLMLYFTGQELALATPSVVQYLGLLWAVLVVPLVVVPILGVAVLMTTAGTLRRKRDDLPEIEARQPGISRREVLIASAAALPPVAAVGLAGFALPQNQGVAVRRLRIPIRNLPPALDGLRIAQVSDSHVGAITHGKVIDRIVDATSALEADLVCFTGDLINYSLSDLDVGIDMIRRFESRYGTFIVEGNHDLLHGIENFADPVRRAGLTLLRRQSAHLRINGQAVDVLGLDWDLSIWPGVDELTQQRRSDAFPILLAHHPHAFDFAKPKGLPLTLAGHTHGGQLMLTPEFGAGPTFFHYWSGLYGTPDACTHISNGVGNWFPLRIRAEAALEELTLVRV